MTSAYHSLVAFAEAKLRRLEMAGQRRNLVPTTRFSQGRVTRSGQKLISFCDNDYLSLSQHPRVVAASQAAAADYGAGAGASRLVAGHNPLNDALEARLAAMKGAEAARVFGSGYLANIGTIPALVGHGDLIVMDALAHACMHAGARLSGAEIAIFPHNDVDAAEAILASSGARHKLLLTETVFSMDGDLAPLRALHEACERHGAWMMTDDAHGFGVLEIDNPAPVQMGTLSKAVGGYGGYVCGPAALMDLLVSRARSFVYTTGLPPTVLAAALAALDVMRDEPDRGLRAMANAALFCELVGLPPPQSAIVPVICGSEQRAMNAAQALFEAGYLVVAIRPPTVPAGTARLRITFTADHQEDDITGLAQAVTRCLSEDEVPA